MAHTNYNKRTSAGIQNSIAVVAVCLVLIVTTHYIINIFPIFIYMIEVYTFAISKHSNNILSLYCYSPNTIIIYTLIMYV